MTAMIETGTGDNPLALSDARRRTPQIGAALILSAALLGLGGCASLAPDDIMQRRLALPAGSVERECLTFFSQVDEVVANRGVTDNDAARIAGFPYLRVDRLQASYAEERLSDIAFDAWVDSLRALDESGRNVEIANLPAADRESLRASLPSIHAGLRQPADALHACAEVLRANDLASTAGRSALQAAVQLPDDYRFWQRAVGLYPLTSIAFSFGARRLQQATLATFDRDLATLPIHGRLIRYAPPATDGFALSEIVEQFKLEQLADDPQALSAPPKAAALETLFAQFAPILEIDAAGNEDRIGALGWQKAERLEVDTEAPTVYHYLSYARFGGHLLPQLNYTIWFAAREREGAFDLLGGHLDGITWRVTLDLDGKALIADAVHNCGCYHLFFPSPQIALKRRPATLEETAYTPQTLPETAAGEHLTIRIAHHTHFIERVLASPLNNDDAGALRYVQLDYDVLRSLPLPDGGSRSAFGADGIVPGTERNERYLYWPMGVPNTGAMRQRGHHATAFVGRRYFDDPLLFEKSFATLR